MAVVLGVDSSTQSTKVQICDLDTGDVVATGAAPHPATNPPRSEQDPRTWWSALVDAVHQTGATHVAGISIAGQQHGMVVLDTNDEVLRPAKLWNDTESAPDAAALLKHHGPGWWAEAVGSVPVASFTVTKLAWLKRVEPQVFDRTATVLLPHDWLTHELTGRAVTDRGDASGTGYWSPTSDTWRPDVLQLVDASISESEWLERLPVVLGPVESVDPTTDAGFAALGLRGAPAVAPGTGDNMAAALGIGLEPGQVAISLGTSATVFGVSEHPVADAHGFVAGFADATGHHLPLVCTLNAGKVIDTIASLMDADLDELAAMAIADSSLDGPILVPYLDGERTPNRPQASGVISGLRTGATRRQLAAAAYRGVACSMLEGLDALQRCGVDVGSGPISLVGGGARSAAHRQIIADLSGRPVLVPAGGELVATGAALQAAAVVTATPIHEVARAWGVGGGTITEPRTVDREAIRQRYAAMRDGTELLDNA